MDKSIVSPFFDSRCTALKKVTFLLTGKDECNETKDKVAAKRDETRQDDVSCE